MTIYEFSVKDANNQDVTLSEYQGKWVLIANTASQCGFTPQYQGMQELADQYPDQLAVLAFPCNQFGGQEPGDDNAIQQFCQVNYGVSFPVLAKVDVNGDEAEPLFQYLKSALPGLLGTETIKWNFTKFLVAPDGEPLRRFAPSDKPRTIGRFLADRIKEA